MRFRFRLGKSGKLGRLTPEQEAVLKRLDAGEITADEAAKELGGTAHAWTWFSAQARRPSRAGALAIGRGRPGQRLVECIAHEVETES